jgi:hypothetical protein
MKKEIIRPTGHKTYSVITEQLQGAPKTHELKTFIYFDEAVHYFLERCDDFGLNNEEGDGDEIIRRAGGVGHDFRVELIQQNVITLFRKMPERTSTPIK